MKLLLIAFLALSTLVFSSGNAYAQTKPKQATITPIQASAESKMSEGEFYEKMYNQAQQTAAAAHADFLWSLAFEATIVLGVVAFLLGAQYLNNIRINKQEIASFESRINAKIEASVIEFQVKLNELGSSIAQQAHLNKSISESIMQQFDNTQSLIHANLLLDSKQYFNALQAFLQLIESIESIENVPTNVIWMLHNCVTGLNELQQSDFERINKIKASLEKSSRHKTEITFFQSMGNGKPVYLNEWAGPKVYIRNPPTPR